MEPRYLMTVLLGWDTNPIGQTWGAQGLLANTTAVGVSNSTGLTRGSGVGTSGTAAARAWGGNNWVEASSAGAISADDTATFGLTVGAGKAVSFESINLEYRRSGTGPSSGQLQYSINGGTFTNAGALAYGSSSSSGATHDAIDLTGVAALQGLAEGTAVNFRFVNFGGTSAGGTWYVFDVGSDAGVDDLTVNGTVTDVVATTNTSTAITSITPHPANAGDTVTFEASVNALSGSSTPTGTVAFITNNGTGITLASGPLSGSGTTANVSTTAVLPSGSYTDIVAVYTPSGLFGASTSSPNAPLTVNPSVISFTGATHDEDFDGLPTGGQASAGPTTPIEIAGLPGWAYAKAGGTSSGNTLSYQVSNGASNTGAVFNYGTTDDSDRALGLLASGTNFGRIGAIFSNDSGSAVDEITISFDAETWRAGDQTANTLAFEYKLAGAGISDEFGWTPVTALDATRTGDAAPLGGQARVGNTDFATLAAGIAGLNWQPGQTLVIRLTDANDSGADDGLAIDNFSLSAGPAVGLPAWVAPGSVATWDAGTHTLNVTGAATIIADPGVDVPIINATGASAVLTIDPASDQRIHVGGLNLTGGATATVTSLGGARTATNHRVLVVPGSALSIDGTSQLDLTDNDLIVKNGNALTVEGLAFASRNVAGGGSWDGTNGITSSTAAAEFIANGLEITSLGVLRNGDNVNGAFTTFAGESVTENDVLVKYTYAGDFTLDGQVNGDDEGILGLFYDNGASNEHHWFDGDLTGNGTVDADDEGLLGLLFGNGTAGSAFELL
ncbi:MAG: Ig-like domain-containing protein [Tepidisphaeraceae bacterium]